MPPMKPDTPGPSIHQLHNTAINLVEALCSVLALPVECLLRPRYGTRFYEPPIVFFSAVLMIMLPVISAVYTGLIGMIPFTHPAPPVGLFDIGSLAKLFFLAQAYHCFRLHRLMVHMEREECSTYEGPALPFFQLIPWSRSFWITRCALEPAFVLLLSIVLQDFFLMQSCLATYLQLASVALAMKGFISWHHPPRFRRPLRYVRQKRSSSPPLPSRQRSLQQASMERYGQAMRGCRKAKHDVRSVWRSASMPTVRRS